MCDKWRQLINNKRYGRTGYYNRAIDELYVAYKKSAMGQTVAWLIRKCHQCVALTNSVYADESPELNWSI